MGIYSGIDMSMVDKIMEAEAAKGTKFTRQKEQYTKSQNAWKDMNTRLDSLYKRLEDLQKPETFNSKSVTLTGSDNVGVTAGSNAATGNYRVQVQQLATQTRFTGSRVSIDSIHTDLNMEGSFSFNLGVGEENLFTFGVEIGDSLKAISEKVNNQSENTGIRSSIVDNRLIFTHIEYGVEKKLEVSSQGIDNLGLNNGTLSEGKNALLRIDGLDVERTSNTITDVIEGLSFNLTNVHSTGESTVVGVTENLDKAADALQKFVEQYNSTMNFVKSQLSVGDPSAENNTTGTLSGDGTLMRLQSSLRSMVTSQESHGTSINGLQSLGVTVDRNGTASFDRTVLEKQVKENPNDVKDFFSSTRQVANEDGEGTTTERKGFSTNMRSFVNQYISSSSGIIKTRRETYDRMIRDVNDRITKFEERLEMRKNRYIKQFSALDTAMMKAESQMDFMYSQLNMNQN